MAEENRTERATPYRRKKLREEGNVAKSPEIAPSVLLLIGSIVTFFLGAAYLGTIGDMFKLLLLSTHVNVLEALVYSFQHVFKLLLPFFVIPLVVVILSHVAQFGFIFTLKPLSFKWERLNPLQGIKRIFSLNLLFEMVKNTLKATLFLLVVYMIVKGEIYTLLLGSVQDLGTSLRAFILLVFKVVVVLGVLAVFLALLDYGYRRWDYERRIRMSKQEIKEEIKQHEGDPLIKSAIRKRMRQLARGRMFKEVPKASVVITNPTHIAIALRYIQGEDRAPVVVAKGKGSVAEKIVQIASESQVPVVRKEELARAMYPAVEVGEEIPPKFYRAVAEIIAFIMYKRKRWVA